LLAIHSFSLHVYAYVIVGLSPFSSEKFGDPEQNVPRFSEARTRLGL